MTDLQYISNDMHDNTRAGEEASAGDQILWKHTNGINYLQHRFCIFLHKNRLSIRGPSMVEIVLASTQRA